MMAHSFGECLNGVGTDVIHQRTVAASSKEEGKALDAEAKLHEAGRAAVRAGILNIQPSRRA